MTNKSSIRVFGPETYGSNLVAMEKVNFRALTTSESILNAAHEFDKDAKPKIFDLKYLQAGRIMTTSDGVWVNVPRYSDGELATNLSFPYLSDAKKIKVGKGFIYLCHSRRDSRLFDEDLGFAEYNTFENGVQDCDTFVQSGLARVLEHTSQKSAQNLRVIANPKLYPNGVHIRGIYPPSRQIGPPIPPFLRCVYPEKKFELEVINFVSGKGRLGNGRLYVGGIGIFNNLGYAYGGAK